MASGLVWCSPTHLLSDVLNQICVVCYLRVVSSGFHHDAITLVHLSRELQTADQTAGCLKAQTAV